MEQPPLLFDSIAHRYDCTNVFLSLGLSTFWYASFIRAIVHSGCLSGQDGETMLDLCCGTGMIPRKLLRYCSKKQLRPPLIYGVDCSAKMIEQAKKRVANDSVHFIHADATALPFPNDLFDVMTISYGVRNLSNPQKALLEAARVLRPGGVLFILELTRPSSPIVCTIHRLYLSLVVPLLGTLCTLHKRPYTYLGESIQHFSPASLLEQLSEAGFVCEAPETHTGGTISIFRARKV